MLTIWESKTLNSWHVNHFIWQISMMILKSAENYSTCLDFQQTQPKEKIIHHEIPAKPWEIVGADMFTLYNSNYIFIVDYHSKFPVIKKTKDISRQLNTNMQNCFFWIQFTKIMSDSGGNFISDKFKTFYRSLNIVQTFSSSYPHKSNGNMEACIKLVKRTLKNALILNLTHI